jgi:hypothetical protein
MSNQRGVVFRVVVLFLVIIHAGAGAACGSVHQGRGGKGSKGGGERRGGQPPEANAAAGYGAPAVVARLENKTVDESSGIVASRQNPGLFWTHNDSGDGPFLYAFDRAGRDRGVWRVAGAEADDWEAIARGPGPEPGRSYLYVGDIGDNEGARPHLTVYRLAEPSIETEPAAPSSRKNPRPTAPAEAIRFRYPDERHDAETLMVHPTTGDIYVVTKSPSAGVYRLRAGTPTAEVRTLERVAELRASPLSIALITGGDISPDGRRLVLCDYLNGYELRLPASLPFDEIWRQQPAVISLGQRQQGEAAGYSLDGTSILATSEGASTPLFEVTLPKEPAPAAK